MAVSSSLHVGSGEHGELRLAVDGPLDADTGAEMALTIRLAVGAAHTSGVVIDLRDAVEVGDASAIEVRLACDEALARGVPVRVVGVPPAGDAPGRWDRLRSMN